MHTLTIYHGAPKPIRVRGEHVCNLVGFAQKYPGWHSLGKDRKDRRALESAKRAGCIETNEFGQFRFVYPRPLVITEPGVYLTRDGRRVLIHTISHDPLIQSNGFAAHGSIERMFRGKMSFHGFDIWALSGKRTAAPGESKRDIVSRAIS